MTSAVAFGRRVRQERSRQCKSLETLARQAGTHASTLSRWERGLRDPRLSTMARLAAALDVPLAELVQGIDSTTTNYTEKRSDPMSPVRQPAPAKKSPEPPKPDVVEKQDPDHTEADFLRDLDRATTNDAKRKLAERARRG